MLARRCLPPINQLSFDNGGRGLDVLGVVQVVNSFPVPHLEKDGEVAVGKDFNKSMLALQQKTQEDLVVVGWYSTATDEAYINEQSCLIQEFFERGSA